MCIQLVLRTYIYWTTIAKALGNDHIISLLSYYFWNINKTFTHPYAMLSWHHLLICSCRQKYMKSYCVINGGGQWTGLLYGQISRNSVIIRNVNTDVVWLEEKYLSGNVKKQTSQSIMSCKKYQFFITSAKETTAVTLV